MIFSDVSRSLRAVCVGGRFLAFTLLSLLALPSLWAGFTITDTSAPHYRGAAIAGAINGSTDSGWNFTASDTDNHGNLYSWGRDGLHSIAFGAYTWTPTLTGYPGQDLPVPLVAGARAQSLAGFTFIYTPTLPPGTYSLYVSINGYVWCDGYWQRNGYYDEEGNWVDEEESWNAPQTGAESTLWQEITVTVVAGGTQPQTISWTPAPPATLPWNDTTPRTLAATSSSGGPVKFSLGPTSSYPYAFTLNGATLTYCGISYGWGANQTHTWTVLAEAPASATHAYTSVLHLITTTKVPQPIATSFTYPGTVDADGYVTINSVVLAAGQISGYTPLQLQLVSGGGRLVDMGNYFPDGFVGAATINASFPAGDLFEASNVCAMTVNTFAPPRAPAIVGGLAGHTVEAGGSATFTANIDRGIPSAVVQWWKNGTLLAGQSSPTLALTNVQAADAGDYVLKLTNTSGTATSNPATLTVTLNGVPVGGGGSGTAPAVPQITQQPVNRRGDYNGLTQLYVEATGSPAPQFVWLKNGVELPPAPNRLGLSSNRLTLIDLRDADAGNYAVRVSNTQGSVTSVNATVGLFAYSGSSTPVITRQPSNVQILPGASTALSVEALGLGPLRFRWTKNGGLIPGATASSYALSDGVQGTAAGNYAVEVSNTYGSVQSTVARITVGPSNSPPFISEFTMPVLAGAPFALDLLAANPTAANPNPPTRWVVSNLPAGLSLAPTTGVITGVPTVVGLYEGSYSAENAAGLASKPYLMNVLGPASPPWIFSQSADTVAVSGGEISLQVYAASGGSPLQYQWRRNGVPVSGATNFALSISAAQPSDAGNYDAVVSNANGNVTSQAATVNVVSVSANGSPPSATIDFPVIVTRPDGTERAAIPRQTGFPIVNVAATVGDTITVRFHAADRDADLKSLELDVFFPDVLAGDYYSGYWNYDLRQNWVAPGSTVATGNPFRHAFPIDDSNRANSSVKTVSFVLDSAGVWRFFALAVDEASPVHISGSSPENMLFLRVNNPVLTEDTPITAPSGLTRLVGAYFNAGQMHNIPGGMWRPASGRWDYQWGPNPVVPFSRHSDSSATAAAIVDYYYLGWGSGPGAWPGRTPAVNIETSNQIAAELKYCGVDFIVIDHTNLIFSYGNNSQENAWEFTNLDNCVTRAASELRDAFARAGSARIKLAFLLGMTTAWYMDGMEPGRFPGRALEPFSFGGTDGVTNVIDQQTVDNYINGRIPQFNSFLQKLWNEFASIPGVWQLDPDNQKPMLFLYVGTDGSALFRDTATGKLQSTGRLRIIADGQEKTIDQAFSVKYVSAGMTVRPIFTTTRATAPSGVSFPCFRELWSFREGPDRNTPEGSNVIGTLNSAGTAVDIVQVSAYRRNGGGDFVGALDRAIAARPRMLILTAWNEFGSLNDEPSPEASWTIMPNNKYGRRYSEIVRQKVINYKSQTP